MFSLLFKKPDYHNLLEIMCVSYQYVIYFSAHKSKISRKTPIEIFFNHVKKINFHKVTSFYFSVYTKTILKERLNFTLQSKMQTENYFSFFSASNGLSFIYETFFNLEYMEISS